MSAKLELEDNRLCVLRVAGELKKAELEEVQADFVRKMLPEGSVKLLILLEGFRGWEHGADWGDTDFFFSHRNEFDRLAIVGDPRWEPQVLAFSGAGMRKGPVQFFLEGDEIAARAWLAE